MTSKQKDFDQAIHGLQHVNPYGLQKILMYHPDKAQHRTCIGCVKCTLPLAVMAQAPGRLRSCLSCGNPEGRGR